MSPYFLAVALFYGAPPADAQNGIYNVTIAGSGLFSTTPNSSVASATNFIDLDAGPGPILEFTSRYGFNVNADAGVDLSRAHEASAIHQVNFEVRSNVNYTLVVGTAFVGELTYRADDPECSGTADVSGVTGNASMQAESGSLNLDDPGFLNGGLIERIDIQETGNATFKIVGGPDTQTFAIGFGWIGSVSSNSCEVAVRMGASAGATQGCDACGYPGAPPRSETEDGHFVAVLYLPSECGDGSIDLGEECDSGQFNGPLSCCDDSCQVKADGAPCNDGLFCTGLDRCLDGQCSVHPGVDCGPCFFCDPVLDLCDPIVCDGTPTVTPTPTTTPTPPATPTPPMASCESPYNAASYNVNGANCTFCEVIGGSCATECVGPALCACETGDAECCAATPCCVGCPDAASLECTKLTCTCNPDTDACCRTNCPCAGDCNGDGHTSVNELVKGVVISQDLSPISACVSFNTERNGEVRTEELVRAVNVALQGCGAEP